MKRRIVSSVSADFNNLPLEPEVYSLVSSEGMAGAVSFIERFQTTALFPSFVFSHQNVPEERFELRSRRTLRDELRILARKSSVISIKLEPAPETWLVLGHVVCEIVFRRNGLKIEALRITFNKFGEIFGCASC